MNLTRLRQGTLAISFVLSNIGINLASKTGCIYPFLFCYGCPLAFAACPIGTLQHFVILSSLPLYLIGAIGTYGMIFGRFFCGWACPFGALHDVLAHISKSNGVSKRRTLKRLPYAKYIMLLLVIGLAWLALDTVFCKFCPAGSLFAAIPATVFYPNLTLGVFFYVHIATLVLVVLLGLFFARFWCRYLCPLGSIGAFNKLSILTVSVDSAKCVDCQKCLDICPMGIEKIDDIGSSSDCIRCGKCVVACHNDALRIGLHRNTGGAS